MTRRSVPEGEAQRPDPDVRRASVVIDHLGFPEGPRWHEGRLWFSDISGGRISSLGADSQHRTELEVQQPSGLGWLPDGRLLITTLSLMDTTGERAGPVQLLRVDTDGVKVVLDMAGTGEFFNDMVVGPSGDAYLDLGGMPGEPGKLLLVRPDGTHEVAAEGIAGANGIAITADARTLLVSETGANRISAFTISSGGQLIDRRVFAPDVTTPDGLCVDAEGAAWVGSYSTGEFLRVADGGEVLARVGVSEPGWWALAPALGGADRRTLYMATAKTSVEEMKRRISHGRIEMIEVDVPGAGWP